MISEANIDCNDGLGSPSNLGQRSLTRFRASTPRSGRVGSADSALERCRHPPRDDAERGLECDESGRIPAQLPLHGTFLAG
jgi:hypothetical protein